MTPDEALEILIVARALDARIGEPDEVKARVWARALDGLPTKGVMAAIEEHYRHSSETLNVGHIRPLMRQVMADWRRAQHRKAQEAEWARQRLAIEAGTKPEVKLTGWAGNTLPVPEDVDPARSAEKQAAWSAMREILGDRPRPKRPWYRTPGGRPPGDVPGEFVRGAGPAPARLGDVLGAAGQQMRSGRGEG